MKELNIVFKNPLYETVNAVIHEDISKCKADDVMTAIAYLLEIAYRQGKNDLIENIGTWVFEKHHHHDEKSNCDDTDFPYINSLEFENFIKNL